MLEYMFVCVCVYATSRERQKVGGKVRVIACIRVPSSAQLITQSVGEASKEPSVGRTSKPVSQLAVARFLLQTTTL